METYDAIFKNHDGLISHKWIHYFFIYDQLFKKYREDKVPVNILEIGVDRGGSLEIWKKYLPEGSMIHGIDINPKCNEIQFSENIFFYLGSASDKDFIERTFQDMEFDIILDDGSHICSDVIKTFEIMFPRIKKGGLYVVEDLHTSYWKNWEGGFRKKGSSIEYFKNLIEELNFDYLHTYPSFYEKISEKVKRKINKYFRKSLINKKIHVGGGGGNKFIESVTFYDSICAIKKFSYPKTNPFISVITGKEDKGVVCVNNELEFVNNVKNMYGAK